MSNSVIYTRKISPRISDDPFREGVKILTWAKGCTEECSFCRSGAGEGLILSDKPNDIDLVVRKFLRQETKPVVLDATVNIDGFLEPVAAELVRVITAFADKNKNLKEHKLLISTRQAKVPNLFAATCPEMNNIIFRVYLTAWDLYAMYETGCPSPFERIQMLQSQPFQSLLARGAKVEIVFGPVATGRFMFMRTTIDSLAKANIVRFVRIQPIEIDPQYEITAQQAFVCGHYKLTKDSSTRKMVLRKNARDELIDKVTQYVEQKGFQVISDSLEH